MTPALANYDCLTGLWNPDTSNKLDELINTLRR